MASDNTPLLRRKALICAKLETDTGVAEALAAADGAFIAYIDDNPLDEDITFDQREAISSMETLTGTPGPRMAKLKFQVDFAGNGAAGLPLWATVLLPACGMLASSQAYSFVTGPATLTTLTIGIWFGGRQHRIAGAMGTWSLTLNSGRAARIEFEFTGLVVPDQDIAQPTPTFPTVLPPRWANTGAIALGAFTPKISTCTIAAGNEVVMREDANGPNNSGYRSAVIVDRAPTATCDPESALVADHAVQSLLLAGTEFAFSAVIGDTTNNTLTVAGPKCQRNKRTVGSRNKIVTDALDLQFNRNGAVLDASLSMTFS